MVRDAAKGPLLIMRAERGGAGFDHLLMENSRFYWVPGLREGQTH